MRDAVGAPLIAAILFLLTLPSRSGSTAASFALATALMFAVNGALLATFSIAIRDERPRAIAPSWWAGAIAAAAASALVFVAARSWMHQILIYPHDPWRADMLVVIQEGIRRFLRGDNPYTMYHVPWDATLPYGPVMWLPYVVPYVAKIDVRFVSLLGALFAPVACALSACASALERRIGATASSLIMLGALAASPDLRDFSSIAHTPVYWPGLLLLAWFTARERWRAAAVTCGLLIVARTTMVACAPILVTAVWMRNRRDIVMVAALLAAAAVLPYLPFAIRDPRALEYALYGSYQALMKGFVWTSTGWAQNTIGLTGLLLRAALNRWIEITQAAAMLAVYALAWPSIRSGSSPAAWMALALFVFSATTLWPVHYVYFDVVMLWIGAALAAGGWIDRRRIGPAWTITLAATAVVVFGVALVEISAEPTIDVGIGESRPLLYRGFSTNEGEERTFSWIDGANAEILIPRRSRADAEIDIVCQPHVPSPAATQAVSAMLNGVLLGTTSLAPGWHTITFTAPGSAWRVGVNELVLSFSSAASPRESHTGDDPRKLSAAIDRLTVRPKS